LLAILAFIHSFTGSWGMAILGLTVIVKAALFPLSQRAGKSAKAMAALKPEMDATKERFKDDPQRQQEEMMKLMRAHGANPASGCLPVLIQMPIWFALYRSLWVSVDLYQEPFLWMPDLTARDPLWILPVLLVVVMYLQQKMTPTTMDATQQKVMLYFMPLMFGAMMAALPAGLAFYILVNSLLTIAQQHFINRSIGPLTGSSSAQEAAA
jgi:YidC/Oxa1 family membrane protein insertase